MPKDRDGIKKGLYILVRNEVDKALLQEKMNHPHVKFLWTKPKHAPNSLPLYCLHEEEKIPQVATLVSCIQSIAGNGAFSLGMLANFEGSLQHFGPSVYRWLFWETGVIGQVLYLEGSDCFFSLEC